MKNRNLFLAALLAVPFYLTSDNVIESDVNDTDNSEEEVVTEEVLAEDVGKAFLSLALAKKTTGDVMTVDGGNIPAALR